MRLPRVVQIVGLVSISVGAFFLGPAVGFIVAGVAAVVLGVALEGDR